MKTLEIHRDLHRESFYIYKMAEMRLNFGIIHLWFIALFTMTNPSPFQKQAQ